MPTTRAAAIATLALAGSFGLLDALSARSVALASPEGAPPTSASSSAGPVDEEARKLVQEILAKPGGQTPQMCSGGPMLRLSKPSFSPFAFSRGGSVAVLSAKNLARLRATRDKAIPAIVAELEGSLSHLKKIEPEKGPDGKPVDYYYASDSSPESHLLAMLIDLNASEALPALLDVFAKVDRPESDVSFAMQVLSTLTAILRQERWKPLLESEWEKAWERTVLDKEQNWYAKFKTEKQLDERERGLVVVDPIVNVGRSFRAYTEVEATRANKDRVVKWAKDFLAKTPAAERRAAKGMDPWPIQR